MNFSKDDRWLLASHLQKAIRRGLADEAAWAAGHLHAVDRSYLAGRMAVIAIEDLAGADPDRIAADTEGAWGARRFGASKDGAGETAWRDLAAGWARLIKDRTPCEWMACQWQRSAFEAEHGAWDGLDLGRALDLALDPENLWWARGLAAWRLAGTDLYPARNLPEVAGDFPAWAAASDPQCQSIMTGIGRKQREAHVVFLPLALSARKKEGYQVMRCDLASEKVGPWLSAALDKHTAPGKTALDQLLRGQPDAARRLVGQCGGRDGAREALGNLLFLVEGGRCDRFMDYASARRIVSDSETWSIAAGKLPARALGREWMQPEHWLAARQAGLEKNRSGVKLGL